MKRLRRAAFLWLTSALLAGSLAEGAAAQPLVSCERVKAEEMERALSAAAALLNAETPAGDAEAAAVFAEGFALEADVYEDQSDQFVPEVFRGLAGWNEFRSSVAETLQGFRIESVRPFLGCKAALVVGRFAVEETDEYRPWFYEAVLVQGEGGLRLSYLRLPTPVPRKSFGSRDACDGVDGTADKYDYLRENLVAAVKSGREEQLAGLFSRTDILAFFDPLFGGKALVGVEKMLVARAAAARYFADRTVEDLPEERRAVLICKNLNFGGVLKVTDKNGFVRFIGYRAYAPLFHPRNDKRISTIDMGLTLDEVADNLPENVDEWLKPALDEVRASAKR